MVRMIMSVVRVYFVNNKIPTVSVIELFDLRSDFVLPTVNHLNDSN